MATASELRAKAVQYMKDRTKKNSYTQGSKRTYFFGYPDNKPGNKTQKGHSDCSAAVRAAIKAATGIDIGSNTSAQINNRNTKGIIVDQTSGYYPDESKLLPGDCLYFKGNTSHPLDVGHVEMYTGKNECYGHGSGTGPTKKKLKSYCKSRGNSKKRYFMAIRWIKDDTDKKDQAATVKPENGVAIADGTYNVRTGPSTSFASAGIVSGGMVLEKVDLDDEVRKEMDNLTYGSRFLAACLLNQGLLKRDFAGEPNPYNKEK
jgi:hypothetical protein